MATTSDDLSIIIGGHAISGWQEIRVTRGAERVPSSFDLSATERYPGQIDNVAIAPGSPCQVNIGTDLVLTGYVDRVLPSLSGSDHTIRVQGRSKLADIVDCSVTNSNIAGMQKPVGDLVSFAAQICEPFGIDVVSLAGATIPVLLPGGGGPVPINIMLGETGYDVIERIARYGTGPRVRRHSRESSARDGRRRRHDGERLSAGHQHPERIRRALDGSTLLGLSAGDPLLPAIR